MVNKKKMKSSKSGTVKKSVLERFKPKNLFNRSQASFPVPSSPGGEDWDEDVASVQSGVSSPGLQMIVPLLGPSQAQLLTSQSSYPNAGPSNSAQTYDHQGSASSIGPTGPHSKGTVVDPPKTPANPEILTHDAKSTSQSLAGVAWDFTAMLLKRLPNAIDTNPVKIASNIIKIVLEISDAVRENIDVVDKRILSTVDQLRALEEARDGWKPHSDKEMRAVELFESTLTKEYANLIKLKEQSLIRKIADHEKDKGEITEIFQRINEAREQLVIVTGLRVHQIALEIREEVARLLLERLEAAHSADHKYEPEGKDQQSLRRTVCTPGTRVRILGDIARWANDTSSESESIFWLLGQAGSGKTTIAHTIARRFEFAHDADDTIILGGNFFCSRHFKETRSATRIVRTIAYQLALRCKPFADALDHRSFDTVHQNVRTQLQCLLVDPWKRVQSAGLSEVPRFLVIIDALDEIDDEGGSEFLRGLLDSIDKHDLRGLKFFATSRPDQDLVEHLQSFQNKQFYHLRQVPVEEADADVTAYLNAELPRFRDTPEMKKLVEQAASLFIYAATVVKYLSKLKFSLSEQTRRIGRLLESGIPQSTKETPLLDKLYQQVLFDTVGQFMNDEDEDENINFKHRLKILHTFLCSAEPISIDVVANLISPSDEPNFAETVTHVLASLHAVLYTENDKVFSYHKSFTDFIYNENRAKEFWCNLPQFHLLLSRNCFDIMNSELKFNVANIQSSFVLDRDNTALPDAIKQNISPVLRYTCHNWVYHLSLADSNELADTLTNFLKLPVLFWIEAMNLMGSRRLCEYMLRGAHKVVMNNTSLEEAFTEAASFALYFSGSAASLSMPHLYISSLATWRTTSGLSQGWKTRFPGIPKFVHSAGGAALMTITTESPASTIALSSDGKYIVSGSEDRTVQVWDASTGEELKRIVSGSSDRMVRVWDALTGKKLMVLEGHSDYVRSVAFSSDNKQIVSGSLDGTVRVWDASTGEEPKVLEGHTHFVWSVAFSSDNKQIVSGSEDRTVRVWDVSMGKELKVLEGHGGSVWSVAFSSDNKKILKVLEGHGGSIRSVAFSSDNKRIVSGSEDRTVRVWDASMGKELKVLEGHSNYVRSVAFSSNNNQIVSGSDDGTVRVWDASTGEELNVLKDSDNYRKSLCYSRQKDPDQGYTGWLFSPLTNHFLMFVAPDAKLPDSCNILTMPRSAAASLDFTFSTLGPNWSNCSSSDIIFFID
ncbi:WD40 repeat-like protein [Pholiota conissans]|uniref:WD40 repeat-like protein n=1 Tax=Pholiota conissans TaxID=109636 RepID=A0A9P5YKR9_9AGAR|nr:WD40 repeat-like protein [Pholiota conissans]